MLSVSSLYGLNGKMINELEWIWKEGSDPIEVLFGNLPGGTEEKSEKFESGHLLSRPEF
jgi:hypothetical protein